MKKALICVGLFLVMSQNGIAQATVAGHATWNPNPATDNVVQYTVQLNTGTPVVVLPTACTATLCSQAIPAIPLGANTITLIAQNVAITGGSLQSSTPTVLAFTVNTKPVTVLGVGVTIP